MIDKIEAYDATEIDLDFLLRSVRVGDEEPADVLKAIANGSAVLWRIYAKGCRGIMVTTVMSNSLFVWHLSGVGLYKYRKTLVAELKDITVRNKMKSVTAQVVPTLAKLLFRTGFDVPRLVVEWRTQHG